MINKSLIKTPYGIRSVIGVGDEATVYQYHTGPYKGLVGRVQERNAVGFWDCPVFPKNVLYRFRSHQIAYTAFPQYNIDVVALDFYGKQMFSRPVKRSRTNKKDATIEGKRERKREYQASKTAVELPLLAKEAADTMQKSGIYVNPNIANVSVTRDEIKFFEVSHIRKELLPARVDQNLIAAQDLELKLESEELQRFLADERFRAELLKSRGLEYLADCYSKELGSVIILR